MNKYIRVGNIESRKPVYLFDPPPDDKNIDIVVWSPNPYYGHESDYDWDDEGCAHLKGGYNVRIHPSCFKNSEQCMSVAGFRYDPKEPCYELQHVCFRPFELSKQDYEDYLYVIRQVYKALDKELTESIMNESCYE